MTFGLDTQLYVLLFALPRRRFGTPLLAVVLWGHTNHALWFSINIFRTLIVIPPGWYLDWTKRLTILTNQIPSPSCLGFWTNLVHLASIPMVIVMNIHIGIPDKGYRECLHDVLEFATCNVISISESMVHADQFHSASFPFITPLHPLPLHPCNWDRFLIWMDSPKEFRGLNARWHRMLQNESLKLPHTRYRSLLGMQASQQLRYRPASLLAFVIARIPMIG